MKKKKRKKRKSWRAPEDQEESSLYLERARPPPPPPPPPHHHHHQSLPGNNKKRKRTGLDSVDRNSQRKFTEAARTSRCDMATVGHSRMAFLECPDRTDVPDKKKKRNKKWKKNRTTKKKKRLHIQKLERTLFVSCWIGFYSIENNSLKLETCDLY